MRTFAWEAVDGMGLLSRGEARAASEAQLEELLARRGLTLVRLRLPRTWARREPEPKRVPAAELAEFARYVSVTCRAGLSVVEGLSDFAARSRSPRLRGLLQRVAEEVRAGAPLGDAVARHGRAFDPVFVSMVRAGEASGTLDDAMLRAAEQLEFRLLVRHQLRGALLPLAILLLAVVGLVVLLLTFLLPRLMGLMAGTVVALPLPTRVLMAASDVLITSWPWIVGGLAALVVTLRIALRQRLIALHASRLVLRLPAVGPLLRMGAEARFTATMRSLLGSGVDAVRALQMSAETSGSSWMTASFLTVARRIEAGEPLAAALGAAPQLNPLLVRMLQLGEKAGKLQETLGTAVDWYAAEIPRRLKRTLQLLEPAIVVSAGALIAFIVLAAVLPVFSLYDSLG